MSRLGGRLLICAMFVLIACGQLLAQSAPMGKEEMVLYAAESTDGTWRKAGDLPGDMTSRELFNAALALCEAGINTDRVERLMQVAERMQDRDTESGGYGNFRWSWEDGAVLDFNAVEFCMQAGVPLWIRHRDALSATARDTLQEMMQYAAEGCLRHRVPSSYTNIALMNAENLILLGEALDKEAVADEGYSRLEQFCLYTWESGIHEYCSPTYYGVDLDCLVLIEAFCKRETGQGMARALLELFWTDLAANWYPASERLGGARSRDYDYLRGLGFLDVQMWFNGWLSGDARGGAGLILPALGRWRPDPELKAMNSAPGPRIVRQRWGIGATQGRTHLVLDGLTLSSAGSGYGQMDLPLTVDIAGDREMPRCYFIPDARRDPYGKKKIPAGPHEKTLHLQPLWLAAQRECDALGLVIYRQRDYPENPASLESHFVMPRNVDGFWIGDRQIELDDDTPAAFPLKRDEALFLRQGESVVGIRAPWTRGLDGADCQAALVWDGNAHGVVRLTVAHHSFWGVEARDANAGAAMWIRAADSVATADDFAQWRKEFSNARCEVDASPEKVSVSVAGLKGPVAVETAAPFAGSLRLEPAYTDALLEVNGKDLGREILADLPIIKSYREKQESSPVIAVKPEGQTVWEAEVGVAIPPMVVGRDDDAFGSSFAWTPGEPGERGGGTGKLTWRLAIAKRNTYYVWGRLKAATPEDDSFFVRLAGADSEPLSQMDWHVGVHENWEWAALRLGKDQASGAIDLPAGEYVLELSTREDGTKIDQLLITTDPEDKPN